MINQIGVIFWSLKSCHVPRTQPNLLITSSSCSVSDLHSHENVWHTVEARFRFRRSKIAARSICQPKHSLFRPLILTCSNRFITAFAIFASAELAPTAPSSSSV